MVSLNPLELLRKPVILLNVGSFATFLIAFDMTQNGILRTMLVIGIVGAIVFLINRFTGRDSNAPF